MPVLGMRPKLHQGQFVKVFKDIPSGNLTEL